MKIMVLLSSTSVEKGSSNVPSLFSLIFWWASLASFFIWDSLASFNFFEKFEDSSQLVRESKLA